jgi:hypothetical protein
VGWSVTCPLLATRAGLDVVALQHGLQKKKNPNMHLDVALIGGLWLRFVSGGRMSVTLVGDTRVVGGFLFRTNV